MRFMKLALVATLLSTAASPAMAAYDYKDYEKDQNIYYTSNFSPVEAIRLGNVHSAWDWQYRDRLKSDGFHVYYRNDRTSNYAPRRVLAGKTLRDSNTEARSSLAGKIIMPTY